MEILKYQKINNKEYKVYVNNDVYNLYTDIIIKYELLRKKKISANEIATILKENSKLKAYYECLKSLNTKLRTKKELINILKKKSYSEEEILYAINKLAKEGYLNNKLYIEAYIHDSLTLNTVGAKKILTDLEKLGFEAKEINKELDNVDNQIYLNKIENYISKKLKANKKSANEFKQKITYDLINKGFNKTDIDTCLAKFNIVDNEQEISKLINKLYTKYISKYDLFTTKLKIKTYLYQKGYNNINLDNYIN